MHAPWSSALPSAVKLGTVISQRIRYIALSSTEEAFNRSWIPYQKYFPALPHIRRASERRVCAFPVSATRISMRGSLTHNLWRHRRLQPSVYCRKEKISCSSRSPSCWTLDFFMLATVSHTAPAPTRNVCNKPCWANGRASCLRVYWRSRIPPKEESVVKSSQGEMSKSYLPL
jgi:hypothetical protein